MPTTHSPFPLLYYTLTLSIITLIFSTSPLPPLHSLLSTLYSLVRISHSQWFLTTSGIRWSKQYRSARNQTPTTKNQLCLRNIDKCEALLRRKGKLSVIIPMYFAHIRMNVASTQIKPIQIYVIWCKLDFCYNYIQCKTPSIVTCRSFSSRRIFFKSMFEDGRPGNELRAFLSQIHDILHFDWTVFIKDTTDNFAFIFLFYFVSEIGNRMQHWA